MKIDRKAVFLLLVGIGLRCAAINQPLLDSNLIRQCQTAAVTKSLMTEPGFQVSAKITWLGDVDARYVLELPVYNYLVLGVNFLAGDLDPSGKIVSIALWALSFCVLQLIWRRFLDSQETFWANLLFTVAPLSVFYGQAFMPEMLVQLLAFTFVWLAFRYNENPNLKRWVLLAAVGLLALLIKLPEIAHLYLILIFLILRKERWKALIRPRYLFAAIVTIALLKSWSYYVDSVNSAYLPTWTSSQMLHGFVGPPEARLHLKSWVMIGFYVGAFIIPGVISVATFYGLFIAVDRKRYGALLLWLAAMCVFYLTWFGSGPTSQSYYNLPAVAPLCALAGIGFSAVLQIRVFASRSALSSACVIVLVILSCLPFWSYLFRQDKQILAATTWLKENTQPDDLVLFIPNHRWDMADYPYNPVPAYYADRTTFVVYNGVGEAATRNAVAHARFAVVTLPKRSDSKAISLVNRVRNTAIHIPQDTAWLEASGFRPVAKQADFVAYAKK